MESIVKHRLFFPVVMVLAIMLRFVLIPNPGFEADIAFWKSWGLAAMDTGIVKGLILTNNNYPTPFSYILMVVAFVYSLFANPHIFNQYWQDNNLLFLVVVKMVPILADFGIAALILWIGKNAKKLGFPIFPGYFWKLLAALYLLNPITLIDGALWGQVDSLGVLIFLCAILLAIRKHPFLAGLIYMASMMTKLQNMIYGPIFFLFLWDVYGFSGLMQGIGGALVGFFGLNIEFFMAHEGARVISSLTSNYDYFPWLSLNAYNPWWIVSGGAGMQGSDKMAFIGLANAKNVGLFAFASTYLCAVLFLTIDTVRDKIVRGQKESADTTHLFRFFSALILAAGGFFLFQTESHDRYAFPIMIFLFLWFPMYVSVRRPKDTANVFRLGVFKNFLIGYLLVSIVYFFNLHNALIVNYPKNGIPFLTSFNTPFYTIAASFLQIGFFFLFLWVLRPYMKRLTYLLPIGFFAVALIGKNIPLILKKPVSITKIAPVSYTQGYGTRQIDMPINATFGFNKWSFLSDQYSFFRHGIGTHAPAREVYDINRMFKTFKSDYGIDTEGGPRGSVVFEVYGDGRKLFESSIIKRYDMPRHMDVDIRGVKTLELIVTDGGDGNFDDHADWLNPLLVP